jgi:hypothetical protein
MRFVLLVAVVSQTMGGLLPFWALGVLISETIVASGRRRARGRHPASSVTRGADVAHAIVRVRGLAIAG